MGEEENELVSFALSKCESDRKDPKKGQLRWRSDGGSERESVKKEPERD